MRFLTVAFIGMTLFASQARAEYVSRVVAQNGTLKGLFYLSINPDCTLLGYPRIKVLAPPSNGEIFLTKGRAFPSFRHWNPRSACNSRRVPSMLLEYRPARGFVGSDSFSVDVIFPDGAERSDSYNVTVK